MENREVIVYEVGPRDGLQNEAVAIETGQKIAFVDRLTAAGLPVIEVSAFVSPKWVPQLADATEVFAGIARQPETRYAALVPNLRGLERAIAAGVTDVAIFAAASETFSRRNINQTIDESFTTYSEVARAALAAGLRVRGYLSTAFGCPFEGAVPVARVIELTERLLALGVYEVAVSDTIGVAHPGQVRAVVSDLLRSVPADRIALHFHDTRGTALANVLAALDLGVTTFDASAGGLGGCPYAPGASGNLATEDLVYMLHGLGLATEHRPPGDRRGVTDPRTGARASSTVEISRWDDAYRGLTRSSLDLKRIPRPHLPCFSPRTSSAIHAGPPVPFTLGPPVPFTPDLPCPSPRTSRALHPGPPVLFTPDLECPSLPDLCRPSELSTGAPSWLCSNARMPLSYTGLFVLQALAQGHRFGFDIMEATRLPSGTVYPILRRLEAQGLVGSAWEDDERARKANRPRRRNYQLTREGREHLRASEARYHAVARLFEKRARP